MKRRSQKRNLRKYGVIAERFLFLVYETEMTCVKDGSASQYERNKMSKFNTCLRNGFVSLGDDFDEAAEAIYLFGMRATETACPNCYSVEGLYGIEVCLFLEKGESGWHNVPSYGPTVDSRGWNEMVALREYNVKRKKTVERIEDAMLKPMPRYVFWLEKRDGVKWYKFYGTFKIDEKATRASLDTDRPCVVYERISKTAECRKVETRKVEPHSYADFVALKGRMIEFKFMAKIGIASNCGSVSEVGIPAWPGTKFLVVDFDVYKGYVICTTPDRRLLGAAGQCIQNPWLRPVMMGSLKFAVPYKDFDIGYVEVLKGDDLLADAENEKRANSNLNSVRN